MFKYVVANRTTPPTVHNKQVCLFMTQQFCETFLNLVLVKILPISYLPFLINCNLSSFGKLDTSLSCDGFTPSIHKTCQTQ